MQNAELPVVIVWLMQITVQMILARTAASESVTRQIGLRISQSRTRMITREYFS